MKKHLIAAAVAGALAVPAMAQVTVYGSMEVGVANIKGGSADESFTGAVDSVVNTSKLGFQGVEDLGGGLKAGFRLETRLDPNIGDVDEKGNVNFFERGAEVFLEGGFGKVQLGKLDHQGGENNETSYSGNLALFPGGVEIGSDADNTVSYTTPAMGGVKVNLTHSFADNANGNAQATAGTSGLTSQANATGHDGITTYQVSGAIGALSFKVGGGDSKSTAGAKTKVMGGSVGYDLGMAKVSVGYQEQDVANSTADKTFTVLNALVPMGGALAAHVVYGKYDVDGSTDTDSTAMGVGASYALSNRTTLYGIYRATDYGSGGADTKKETIITINHSF